MSKWNLFGYALTAILAAGITYIVTHPIVAMTMPPGPAPRALRVVGTSTVVIDVQPESGLSGAKFVKEVQLQPHGAPARSRILITGPTTTSAQIRDGIAYELLLEESSHLDRLTEELKAETPNQVPLQFEFDAADKSLLFSLLQDARRQDSDSKFMVTVECWYQRNGRYILSTEQNLQKILDH